MKLRISRTTLKTVAKGAKPAWIWDAAVPGFGLRVQPSGTAAWVVSYRLSGSRAKRLATLGSTATLAPDQARDLARRTLAAAREGRDLAQETKERTHRREADARRRAGRVTVAVAVARYLAEIADRESPQTGRRLAPASLEAARSRLAPLVARHGAAALADLDGAAVAALLAGVPAKSRANHFGAIARLLGWAKRAGHVAAVATEAIERPVAPAARTVTPTPADVRTLLDTADRLLAAGRWAPVQRDAITLLFLTGQRRSEITSMDWRDLDLARGVWTQPALKNKARRLHTIALSSRVVALLAARHEAAGRPKAGLVLPGVRRGGSMRANLADLAAVLRAETGLAFRLHDARRAMVSACAECGTSFEVLDALLNHSASASRGGLRSVYNRASLLSQMREAVEIWDSATYSNVVALRRTA